MGKWVSQRPPPPKRRGISHREKLFIPVAEVLHLKIQSLPFGGGKEGPGCKRPSAQGPGTCQPRARLPPAPGRPPPHQKGRCPGRTCLTVRPGPRLPAHSPAAGDGPGPATRPGMGWGSGRLGRGRSGTGGLGPLPSLRGALGLARQAVVVGPHALLHSQEVRAVLPPVGGGADQATDRQPGPRSGWVGRQGLRNPGAPRWSSTG